MPQTAIFGPVFATILLTFAVWVYMFVRRISFIQASKKGLTHTRSQFRDSSAWASFLM